MSLISTGSISLDSTFKYFNPQSSRKYDPGCSSRIPNPDADFLLIPHLGWIPDPGVKKAPDPGSQIRIRNTDCKWSKCWDPRCHVASRCCGSTWCWCRSRSESDIPLCCPRSGSQVLQMFLEIIILLLTSFTAVPANVVLSSLSVA